MAEDPRSIRNGRQIITPQEAERRGAIILPPGVLPAGIRKIKAEDLDKTLPREMVHKRTVICSDCSVQFIETIITPPNVAPKPVDPEDHPDLCRNCTNRINRFLIIQARRQRGTHGPRRI